jgi:hypothetical protein
VFLCCPTRAQDPRTPETGSLNSGAAGKAAEVQKTFQQRIRPLLTKYCRRCHNVDKMKSGVRVDHLDGGLEDRHLPLWKGIRKQVSEETMPPEDEPQPTAEQRRLLTDWIREAISVARTRKREKNGSARRLTVSQYRNTLAEILGLEETLTDVLPPDSVSKEGFVNNGQTLLLPPLLVEAYFDVAEKALDLCTVDDESKPVIQNFRVDLGASINPAQCPDKLILGAGSQLLDNDDFMVTQLTPDKTFAFESFAMRTKWRFIEGYQGNDTVRGWREYDSIYHAVFAGMRGTDGYPKGLAHQAVPEGLLLRPAIPSAEIFQVESTLGPRANFKISLRELPDYGRFRVTVKAAKYDDGLLLDPGTEARPRRVGAISVEGLEESRTVSVEKAGPYQVDVYLKPPSDDTVAPDDSNLQQGLIGVWRLDGDTRSHHEDKELVGRLTGDAKFVDSPFGKAVSLDGESGAVVVPRDEAMNVGEGELTVTAWMRPRELRQAGIVCLGGYEYTHGWLLDMPDGNGTLRLETATPDNFPNGTVASWSGVLRAGRWQHVAAVVRRGDNETKLYVNGREVGSGTIKGANLDNPKVDLHIGRVQNANLFAGDLDEVRLYRRALGGAEIQALVEPGRRFVQPPPPEKPKTLRLQLGKRHFAGVLHEPAFLVVRLAAEPLEVTAQYAERSAVERVVLTSLEETAAIAKRFATFERRSPRMGVHVGLRRDCGSTLNPVGTFQTVSSFDLKEFVFEGAINNFPSPDVEKDNVNYLAGIREIGVRSEYTDGRDMPRLLVRSVEFEGPLYESWPPATHRRIFIEPDNKNSPAEYAREVIRSFASRAFRRPATDAELATVFAVWEDSFAETNDFRQSIKDALLVVLTSPQFLFIIESSETPEPEDLDPYELASKLSYFLWNAPPDERLLKLAAAGSLRESLDAETDRMIQDPRFERFAGEFASQWLSLDKLDVVEVDRTRYPKLTRDTKAELRKEPVHFLRYLIQANLPLRNLIQSDFIMANEVVAGYYGLADRTESGFEFVPIRHEDDHLGGVLTLAGVLAGLSDGRESNPVKRGAWLARKIIAEPPDDPPPNVPALPEDDGAHLTLREKLERHRDQPGCKNCHAGIDPWGLPLEQFDAGGLFKRDKAVDAGSTLPDKTEIADANGLKAYLANDRLDQVAFSFLKHLATYAIGRSLTYNEIEFLKRKGLELRSGGYRMKDLIRFVIKSELFLEK